MYYIIANRLHRKHSGLVHCIKFRQNASNEVVQILSIYIVLFINRIGLHQIISIIKGLHYILKVKV
jgi:hypothetical protein